MPAASQRRCLKAGALVDPAVLLLGMMGSWCIFQVAAAWDPLQLPRTATRQRSSTACQDCQRAANKAAQLARRQQLLLLLTVDRCRCLLLPLPLLPILPHFHGSTGALHVIAAGQGGRRLHKRSSWLTGNRQQHAIDPKRQPNRRQSAQTASLVAMKRERKGMSRWLSLS